MFSETRRYTPDDTSINRQVHKFSFQVSKLITLMLSVLQSCMNTGTRSAACGTCALVQQKCLWFRVDLQLSAVQVRVQAGGTRY
jgi:Na+/serine symporter